MPKSKQPSDTNTSSSNKSMWKNIFCCINPRTTSSDSGNENNKLASRKDVTDSVGNSPTNTATTTSQSPPPPTLLSTSSTVPTTTNDNNSVQPPIASSDVQKLLPKENCSSVSNPEIEKLPSTSVESRKTSDESETAKLLPASSSVDACGDVHPELSNNNNNQVTEQNTEHEELDQQQTTTPQGEDTNTHNHHHQQSSAEHDQLNQEVPSVQSSNIQQPLIQQQSQIESNNVDQEKESLTSPDHYPHNMIGINYSPYSQHIPGALIDYSMLGKPNVENQHRKCLAMDLDETLVHSSFKPVPDPDFIVPVEIDGNIHEVYVMKRPRVDEFLKAMSELFECVLFTASLAKYADPVSDYLDPTGNIFGRRRLFREQCVNHSGSYIKDLGRIGRQLENVLLLDNCSASYMFQPENGIPITSWFDDMADDELIRLIEPLTIVASAENVYEGIARVGGITRFPFYQQNPHLLQQAFQQTHYQGNSMLLHQSQYQQNPYMYQPAQQTNTSPITQVPQGTSSQQQSSTVPSPSGDDGGEPEESQQQEDGLASVITQVPQSQVVPQTNDQE